MDEFDFEQNNSIDKLKIFSQIECEYNANILKKKMDRKDQIDEHNLHEMYFTALRTVGAVMNLLLLKKLYRRVHKIYRKEEMITVENCIKVLVRAKKMYEAKNEILKILKLIIKRENLKKEIQKQEKMITMDE